MNKRPDFRLLILGAFWACAALAFAQQNQSLNPSPGQGLDREFKAAVAQYNAGRFPEAAAQLEKLLPHVPNSFEAHELLGLVYAAQSQDAKAVEQLELAVRLNPNSAAARTNLAASLVHTGKPDPAAEQLRKALELEPKNYDANHDLGELFVQSTKLASAIPYLEAAQQIQPASYDNGYDLAMACYLTGRLAEARSLVQRFMEQKNTEQKDTAELHNLLGQIDEKDGKYLESVKEFEVAARMEPTDDNLFDWGSELLLHRTYEPAIDVFQQAALRFPKSPRLSVGLGMALYARGKYDEALKALLHAADLDPTDARCYLYLSKAYDSSPNQADDVIQRFRRYAELQPDNGRAVYYYAMSLWKGKRAENPDLDLHQIEVLLEKAIALDPKLAEAHQQLGSLYADQHAYAKSMPEFQRALELDPNLPDAHYRLGQDYVHTGQKEKAQAEFSIYQRLRAEHLAEVDKERAEVQQFVYTEKGAPTTKP